MRPASALDERAGRVPGAGVDDEPGRLVDDEQVLVLVGDPEVERLGRSSAGSAIAARIELDLLPAAQPVALRPRGRRRRARAPAREQALGGGARADLGQLGDEAVEPRRPPPTQERELRRRHAGAAAPRSAATSAPSRIATPITMKLSARLNAGQ